jgi:hypothetical protein
MPTVADTLCVGLAALREAASIDVADTLVRGLGLVQPEGPDRALFVMPTRLIASMRAGATCAIQLGKTAVSDRRTLGDLSQF